MYRSGHYFNIRKSGIISMPDLLFEFEHSFLG